jgi:hypothetical protein
VVLKTAAPHCINDFRPTTKDSAGMSALRFRRAVFTTALALSCTTVLTACVSATEPEETVVVGLNTRSFGRDSAGFTSISFRVINSGVSPVYLPRCGTEVTADVILGLDTPIAASAVPVWSGAGCFLSLALGPYRLDPGKTVESVQRARLSKGEYRLRVFLSLDPSQDPTRLATSDVINIL